MHIHIHTFLSFLKPVSLPWQKLALCYRQVNICLNMGIFPSFFKHTDFNRRDQALAVLTTNSIRSSLSFVLQSLMWLLFDKITYMYKLQIMQIVLAWSGSFVGLSIIKHRDAPFQNASTCHGSLWKNPVRFLFNQYHTLENTLRFQQRLKKYIMVQTYNTYGVKNHSNEQPK